jgi:hypothetical protein
MTRLLLPGLALIVLLGLMSGRRIATRLLAFSCCNRKICVMIWSPRCVTAPTDTVPVCSLASASGTTFSSPATSMIAKPSPRSAAW